MIKVFLSHSSKQKTFVTELADLIGRDMTIVDQFEFEANRKIKNEIQKSIGYTNIFVFLASKESLASTWCKQELEIARDLCDEGSLIFCAYLIDPSINIEDFEDDIKPWIKKFLVKTYTSVTLLARSILKRINEELWEHHPQALPRLRTFAGRSEEMMDVERLLYKKNPIGIKALVVSGFHNVGRKTFLRKVIIEKIQKQFHPSYEPIQVVLKDSDYIDSFVLQLNNIARKYGDEELYEMLINKSASHESAVDLLNTISDSNERNIISDNRFIITSQGVFVDWFVSLLEDARLHPLIHFFIASRITPKNNECRKYDSVRMMQLSPLSLEKEILLFNDYSNIIGLQIPESTYLIYLRKLTGYPDQVLDVADDFLNGGELEVKQEINQILHRYDNNVMDILNVFHNNKNAMQLLIIMTRLGFASIHLLNQFYCKEDFYSLMEEFNRYGIYQCFGPGKEFIQINPHLADYIERNKLKLNTNNENDYIKKTREIILDTQNENDDLATQLYRVREQLKDHRLKMSVKYLIPSVFLRVIVELYYSEKNSSVIELAKRILYDRNSSYYESVERSIRYWLCLAYCKEGKEQDFFVEVANLNGYHNKFLKGFYFRCQKQYPQALKFYNMALDESTGIDFAYVAKAKHEKVITLMCMDNYYEAHSLAKENYKRDPKNTYHIDAYFRCHVREKEADMSTLNELIKAMDDSYDSRKDILVPTYRAEIEYRVKHDIPQSLNELELIINSNRNQDLSYTIKLYKEVCYKQNLMSRFSKFMKNNGHCKIQVQ